MRYTSACGQSLYLLHYTIPASQVGACALQALICVYLGQEGEEGYEEEGGGYYDAHQQQYPCKRGSLLMLV
jgi:hypothetical protein